MFNHPYICIDTEYDLSDESVLCWMKCVTENGPPGIVASSEISSNNEQMRFYRRKDGNTNHYVAVTARNLTAEEATDIAKSFSDLNPDGDFLIHWSQEPIHDNKNLELEENLTKAIALEAAKLNHNRWIQNKMQDGWKYGTSLSSGSKTSPMCRDWDSLPDSYKRNELERMVSLLEILDKMNLMITKK